MIWRYIFGAVMGVLGASALLFFTMTEKLWFFSLVWLCWMALLGLAGWYFSAKQNNFWQNLLLIWANAAAVTIMLVILEDDFWRDVLIIFAGLAVAFLFIQTARQASGLSYEEKPYRRIRMMLWVFVVYAGLTLVYALVSFFPAVPLWLVGLLGSALASAVSLGIWRMYFAVSWRSLFLWATVIGLAVWEVIWALHFLPFGYLVLGALTVWVWYVMQLLVRFHLSSNDVIWRKQVYFLAANLVLYVLILWLFVRWI